MKKIITSESVNIGHPDKTCDVIADAFLDEALSQDPNAQMAVGAQAKSRISLMATPTHSIITIKTILLAKQILSSLLSTWASKWTAIKSSSPPEKLGSKICPQLSNFMAEIHPKRCVYLASL